MKLGKTTTSTSVILEMGQTEFHKAWQNEISHFQYKNGNYLSPNFQAIPINTILSDILLMIPYTIDIICSIIAMHTQSITIRINCYQDTCHTNRHYTSCDTILANKIYNYNVFTLPVRGLIQQVLQVT